MRPLDFSLYFRWKVPKGLEKLFVGCLERIVSRARKKGPGQHFRALLRARAHQLVHDRLVQPERRHRQVVGTEKPFRA
jgi:hypothetical protein